MRVLLVNDYATRSGGAELQMLALRDALRLRGHDARLLAASGDGEADYGCLGTTSRLRTVLQTANPSAHRSLRRALHDFRPDVVHVRLFLTQLSPVILPLLRGVPALYHVSWYRPVCPLGTKMLPDGSVCTVPAGRACRRNGCVPRRDWPFHMVQRALFLRWRSAFDRVVAVGESVRMELAADGIEGATVLPNGIPPRAARPPLADPPVIAYAGRLVAEKGVDVLLRSFAEVGRAVPTAGLVVAGDGPERRRLEALASELRLGPRVRMLGHVRQDALERVLEAAWVQVAASRWREPFGNSGAEAMMRGTAVVASEGSGLAHVVGDAISVVPRGDAAALADALTRLLRDRDLAEREGARARQAALRELKHDRYVDRVLDVYAELAAAG